MSLFIGTLIITGLCCLAMGIGLVIGGKPLSGGCSGRRKGSPECDSCPKRKLAGDN